MNVSGVINNFRSALLGILPAIERVKIPWHRPDAYDEWDNIVSAIYTGTVVEVLRWAVPDSDKNGFRLPSYDMLLERYTGLSLVEVVTNRSDKMINVFHAYGTSNKPFDTIETRRVSLDGMPVIEEIETLPIDGSFFRLRLLTASGDVRIIDEIQL